MPNPQTASASPSPFEQLVAKHAELLEDNEFTYFELAYTRRTGWMAFICDKPATGIVGEAGYGANRKILAQGQGDSPEEACADALNNMADFAG